MRETVYRCDVCGEVNPMYRVDVIRRYIFHHELSRHRHICDECMEQVKELRKAYIALRRSES